MTDEVLLEARPVEVRTPKRCSECGARGLGRWFRERWLDSLWGGFHARYLCAECPWPKRRRPADWRRRVPGKHGPKSAAGRRRCFLARNGLSPEGTRP